LFSWPAAAQRVVLFNALPEFSHRETERLSPEFFKNFSIFSGILSGLPLWSETADWALCHWYSSLWVVSRILQNSDWLLFLGERSCLIFPLHFF
jgi:hypothetical protein